MTHELKILPCYFNDVDSWKKPFELRKDDRGYSTGDEVIMREHDGKEYTGRECGRTISYILRDCGEYGLMDGHCVLGFAPPAAEEGWKNGPGTGGCEACQAEKDGLNDLASAAADCGPLGELRADAQIYCYDPVPSATLGLYLWQSKGAGAPDAIYNEIARAEIRINYCPICGRRLANDHTREPGVRRRKYEDWPWYQEGEE